ncbi:unnamed protein product [Phyllotreta striolata]|uniref:Filamin-A n=1 Tax=Phyllotreta striolata TaxID=444603 RepID=A0A9N9TV05_PHYSR|nr:unnamed protein product [Phyllotreta striolata]
MNLRSKKVLVYGAGIEPTGLIAGAPAVFTVETFTKNSSDVEVVVKNPKGEKEHVDVKYNDDRNSTYTVSYTPKYEGSHTIHVKVAGKPTINSPYKVNVEGHVGSASKVTAYGPGLKFTGVEANAPTFFEICTKNAGRGVPEATILDPAKNKTSIPVKLHQISPGIWRCDYVTPFIGLHSINVLFAGKPIPNSPFEVIAALGASSSKLKTSGRGLHKNGIKVNEEVDFTLKGNTIREGSLDVQIIGPSGISQSYSLKKIDDNVYRVIYQPRKQGKYVVIIKQGGVEISNSPFEVNVESTSKETLISAHGQGLNGGVVNFPAQFTVETNGETGDLGFRIEGPSQARIECHDNGDGSATIRYYPTAPGEYIIHILCDCVDIPGSPFAAKIVPYYEYFRDQIEVCEAAIQDNNAEVNNNTAKFTVETDGPGLAPIDIKVCNSFTDNLQIHWEERGNADGNYSPILTDTVHVNYNGTSVKHSIHELHDNSKIRCFGPGIQSGVKSNISNTFYIDARKASIGELNLRLTNEDTFEQIPLKLVDTDDRFFTVEYLTPHSGIHKLSLHLDGEEIPIRFNVESQDVIQNVKVDGLQASVFMDAPTDFLVDTRQVQKIVDISRVTCVITSPSGTLEEHLITALPDGTFKVSYTPFEEGRHKIHIYYDNYDISGSPFIVNVRKVYDAQKCYAFGQGLQKGSINKVNTFTVATKEAGTGGLSLEIEGPSESRIICKDNNDGTCVIEYTPTEPGEYTLSIKFKDMDIPGSPFKVLIEPELNGHVRNAEDSSSSPKHSFKHQSKAKSDVILSDKQNSKTNIPKLSHKRAEDNSKPRCNLNNKLRENYNKDDKQRVNNYKRSSEISAEKNLTGQNEQKKTGDKRTAPATDTASPTDIEGDAKETPIPTGRPDKCRKKSDEQEFTTCKTYQTVTSEEEEESSKSKYHPQADEKVTKQLFRTIQLRNLPLHCNEGDISATIKMPNGKIDKPIIEDNCDGTVTVKYDPREEGVHELSVKYNGEHIQGSPYKIHVDSISSGYVTAYGPGLTHGVSGEPSNFTISTKGVGSGGLSMAVEGPSKAEISCLDNKDGTVSVSYLPTAPGEYKISVRFGDKHIKGSPFNAKITGEGRKRNQISVGSCSEVSLPGKISDADIRSLNASIQAPSGLEEPCFLKRLPTGNIGISFTPREIGEHVVSVKKMGTHITNSPFKINVCEREVGDAKKVKVAGAALKEGKTHVNNTFNVDTRNAGFGGLSLSIEGPSKADIQYNDNSDGTLDVSYKPSEPGYYIVNLKFADHHIDGSPFTVKVIGEGTNRQREKIQKQRDAVPVTEVGSQCKLTFKMPGITSFDLSASVTSPGGVTEDAEIKEVKDGLYAVNFVPKELGVHTVSVRYKDIHIPGSPFQFTVGPYKDHGAHLVKAGGAGLERGEQGELNEFNVWTREAGSGELAISVEGPSKAEIIFTDRKDGSCDVSYKVSEPGEYRIGLKFNDQHVPDSPFKVYISPAVGDAHLLEVVQFPEGFIQADKPSFFIVKRNGAKGDLDAKIIGPSSHEDDCFVQIIDMEEYSVRFMPHENGVHKIHVKFNGVHIPGSPFSVKVGKDTADPAAVHASGKGLQDIKTGEKTDFIVDTTNAGTGTLAVNIDGPSKVSMDCTEVEEGYKVRYTPLAPGDYYISIKYNNHHIVGSPFKVISKGDKKVADIGGQESSSVVVETVAKVGSANNNNKGPTMPTFKSNASKVLSKGMGLKKAYIGKQNQFTISANTAGENILFVGIHGPKGPCEEVFIKHQGHNQYAVNYIIRDRGTYLIVAKWGDDHIPGSPFKVEV